MSKCTEGRGLVLGGVQVKSSPGSLDCVIIYWRDTGIDLSPSSKGAVLFVKKQ